MDNPELQLAWQFVERTGVNVFLTGKAGTGKTTFLHRLKERLPKRMVVVAPTGVAAINAGGVTIHSFFQFPLAPYIPGGTFKAQNEKYRFSKEKKNIIRTLDLLVIDEISMVRADLLDQIDAVLRLHKDRNRPFGGVQLLMIGDLSQLAPVTKDSEWDILRNYYDTPYFFGSRALQQTQHVTIELQHVYRQTDRHFINILNEVRDNKLSAESLSLLNSRYIRNGDTYDGTIRLTTHNVTANSYNEQRMDELKSIRFTFKAKVTGNFPESSYPAEETLVLKKGCQVMFLKNDAQGTRYYNGKLGVVASLDANHITVRGLDDDTEIVVEPDVWTNARYVIDKETHEIREEIEGEFCQYPLRLAWAITIHKSQGLTFERAVLDVNAAFAAGQVYVALSRCRTLEGLILTAPLSPSSVKTDTTVNLYMSTELEHAHQTAEQLENLQRDYYMYLLTELFDFKMLLWDFRRVMRLLDEHLYKVYPLLLSMYKQTDERITREIIAVSEAFYRQYMTLILQNEAYETNTYLAERIHKAATYFSERMDDLVKPIIERTQLESDNKDIKERILDYVYSLQQSYLQKQHLMKLVAKEGFSISTYLRYKAISLLNAENSNKPQNKRNKTRDKVDVNRNTDICNPRLLQRLKKWRAKRAEELGRPAFAVLNQRTLIGIVNELPTNGRELLRIPGFGKKSLEMFGKELLAIIQDYIDKSSV